MRSTRTSALALVLACVALLTGCGPSGDTPRTGTALQTYDPLTVTVSDAHVGQHAYFAMGQLHNLAKKPLTIVSVHVAKLAPALREVSVRSYLPPPHSAGTLTWVGGAHGPFASDYPPRWSPQPLAGVVLPPDGKLPRERYLMAEVIVERPGTASGFDLAITYRLGGKLYHQVVGRRSFSVIDAKP
jgi:hypothetical protein